MTIKIRPAILLGELVLGIGFVVLCVAGHFEAAIGVAGIIGTTLRGLVESEEKGS
jgi:hypothetical protein